MSLEVTYMTTTWTCARGHVRSMREDLGDPADRELVARAEDLIGVGGCQEMTPGLGRCGASVRTTREQRTVWR